MRACNCLYTLVILLATSCKTAPSEPRNNGKIVNPNIVFLFADDHTYEAIGALGNDIIQMPNLDRLVNAGATFTHAYNMGGWNGAVCVASRAMIISGATIWSADIRLNNLNHDVMIANQCLS